MKSLLYTIVIYDIRSIIQIPRITQVSLISVREEAFIRAAGPQDCRAGSSNVLQDFGTGLTVDECQTKCLGLDGCTDIIFAQGNGHCKAYDECKRPGDSASWEHYVLSGIL